MKKEPNRDFILAMISAHLKARQKWADCQHFENAAKYHHKVETLIALLEIHDCGSVGGFKNHPCNMNERYLWLKNKYAKKSKKDLTK